MGTLSENCCPKCKSHNLEFGTGEDYVEGKLWPVKCPDCGFIGQQHYNLVFACFTDDDGVEIHPKKDKIEEDADREMIDDDVNFGLGPIGNK